MQTRLADFIASTPTGHRAEKILRACVHCGFCTATCPTYQLLGDELDGPRGRIYQIKHFLEGAPPTLQLQTHLDRCLTCRACETTCPSGVEYHTLLDIGRELIDEQQPRPLIQRLQRAGMRWLFASSKRLAAPLWAGRLLRPVMPAGLRNKILPAAPQITAPKVQAGRQWLLLEGCVQPALAPQINQAAKRVFGQLGIALQSVHTTCCGALPHHLSDVDKARALARANIDAWLPLIERGTEGILVTASGCGAEVRDYGTLLADDPDYATKAKRVAALTRDPIELFDTIDLDKLKVRASAQRVAVHTPCTLQHALHLNGRVDALLTQLGYTLSATRENHLCCGSAGTYSLTQPALSQQLRTNKLAALKIDTPDLLVTANIGCLSQLHEDAGTPIMHWLNLIERDLQN